MSYWNGHRSVSTGIAVVVARWSSVLALTTIFLLIPMLASHSVASPLRYGIGGNGQIFTSTDHASRGGTFDLYAEGGAISRISVEIVDLLIDQSGSKSAAPLGATPFSPKGFVKLGSFEDTYRPTQDSQRIKIPFSFQDIDGLRRPILAGLRISLIPLRQDDEGLNIASSIVGTFAYYPEGISRDLAAGIRPGIDLLDPRASKLSRDVFPFSLIPDLPWLFTKGPIALQLEQRNTGNIFFNSRAVVEVSKSMAIVRGNARETMNIEGSEVLLLPAQVLKTSLMIQNASEGEVIDDPFSGIGIYRVHTTLVGSIGRERLAEDSETQFIAIFPWKQVLVVLLVLFTFRRQILSFFMGLRRLSSDFKIFREQQRQVLDESRREVEERVVTKTELKPLAEKSRSVTRTISKSSAKQRAGGVPKNPKKLTGSKTKKKSSRSVPLKTKSKAVKKT